MRRRTLLALAPAAILNTACWRTDTRWTFTLSSQPDAERSGSWVWATEFARVLGAGSGLRMLPGSVLGREDMRNALQRNGRIELDESSADELAVVDPGISALQLPFMFDDDAHLARFIDDGRFLRDVNSRLEQKGLVLLDTVSLGGMSGVFTTHMALNSIGDFPEIRLRGRTRDDLELLTAWGIRSAQVAWEEIAQALATGVVDGYLNPPLVPLIFGHTRQIRHFLDVKVNSSLRVIVASRRWLDAMSTAGRAQVNEAVIAARAKNREWANSIRAREFQMLNDAGIAITHLPVPERDELKARSKPLWSRRAPPERLAPLLDWIEETR